MPQKLHWSEAIDMILRRARAEGHSWDSIAELLGLSRWTVIDRGRRIGARRPPPEFTPKPDLSRPPLPAGHPLSWGLLTEGTCLRGVAYPPPGIPALAVPPSTKPPPPGTRSGSLRDREEHPWITLPPVA